MRWFMVLMTGLYFVCFSNSTLAQAQQKIIVEVIVNDAPAGKLFFSLDDHKRLWGNEKTLEAMRLKKTLWMAKKVNNLVALDSLAPQLTYLFDEENARLKVTVEPDWLMLQIIGNTDFLEQSSAATTETYSAFLNYQPLISFNNQQGFVSLNTTYNLGLNLDQVLIDSSFNLNYQDGAIKNSRLLTTLRWDDVENSQTVTLGDIVPRGQRLFNSAGLLGGISWRKNFQLNRTEQISPELELRTAVSKPTHARVFINDLLVKEVDLLPGQVVLNQLPTGVSQGQAKLELSDNQGIQQTIVEPFYLMYSQLKQGVLDFDFNVGFARQQLGVKDFVYHDLSLQTLYRYGLTNITTLGMAFLKQPHLALFNPQLQTTLGQYQQLELDTAFSLSHQQFGTALEGRYRFQSGGFQLQASGNWFSSNYNGFDLNGSSLQSRFNAMLRYGHKDFGVLTATYNQSVGRAETLSEKNIQLSYGKRLFDNFYATVSAQHSFDHPNSSVFLSLEYRPILTKENSNPLFDNLRYTSRYLAQSEQNGLQNELNLSRSHYLYNYNAQLIQKDSQITGNLRGQYKADNQLYTVGINRSEDKNSVQLGIAGGIVALPQGIYFGRPVSDSFAVVEINNPDKPTLIRANNSTIMETEQDSVLLPEFSSYSNYQIAIQSKQFNNLKDIRYQLEKAIQPLVIKKRSGAFLDLKITRIFAVEGYLYINTPAKKEYLALLPLRFNVNDQPQEGFTGENGYFYLDNLKRGQNILTVLRKEGDCKASFEIADMAKNLLNLGEVKCQLKQESKKS